MYELTSAEIEEIYRHKEEYLKRLQLVFKMDPRSGVDSINYHRNFGGYPEVVEVKFTRGHKRYINVTGNSNWANYRQVGHAVYGGDVVGEFYIREENVNAGTDV